MQEIITIQQAIDEAEAGGFPHSEANGLRREVKIWEATNGTARKLTRAEAAMQFLKSANRQAELGDTHGFDMYAHAYITLANAAKREKDTK